MSELATAQLTFDEAQALTSRIRDAAISQVARNSGHEFQENAKAFVIHYLLEHKQASGEDITDAAKAAGMVPHDDRAFGAVYGALVREGKIEKVGMAVRRKGHLTGGGNVWALKGGAL